MNRDTVATERGLLLSEEMGTPRADPSDKTMSATRARRDANYHSAPSASRCSPRLIREREKKSAGGKDEGCPSKRRQIGGNG